MNPQARELRQAIRNPACRECTLWDGNNTVCLTGDGPVPARVAIYGEAPGWNEDESGLPFVGKAGQLLNSELAKAGIKREDVFVSNVVRCRPPENRTPTKAEIKACRRYTEAELAAVNPEIVLILGNTPLDGLLKQSGIMAKRGAAQVKDGRTYLPTFHPSFVLRDPGRLEAFQSDLNALKRLIDGNAEPPKTEVNIIQSAGDLGDLVMEVSLQDPSTAIVVDVETSHAAATPESPKPPKERDTAGLESYAKDGRLDTVSLTWVPGVSWVVPIEHPDSTLGLPSRAISDAFTAALRGKRIGGHNVKFDLQWLRSRGIRVPDAWFDTLVMAQLLDENRMNGLKPLARSLLGADLYEKDTNYGGYTPLPELGIYNGKDTDYTLRLYLLFREQLARQPRLARIYKHISMPTVNALAEIETVGFPVHLRRLVDRNQELVRRMTAIETELLSYVPHGKYAEANWHRSNFLLWFLFEHLGLPVMKLSAKTESPSVDEDTLLDLAPKHPAVSKLLEWRGLDKLHGTYTEPWLAKIKTHGVKRLYPSYKVTGTVTGRLSSNMQQVPRDNLIRGIIAAPKGYTLIEADYSQIELRVAAMIANEPTMLAAYQRGDDIHMLTAEAITGRPRGQITHEERSRAKPVNFGFIYGMGWRKYVPYARAQYGIVVTDEEAEHLRTAFFLRYPGLVDWHARQRRIVQGLGKVVSPIGRVRRLPAVNSSDREMAAEAERQAINSPVQGLASDLTLLAMSRIHRTLSEAKDVARVIGQVHDSILIEVREDHAEQTAELVKHLMETLPLKELFGWQPNVPIVADTKIGRFWGGE